MTLIHTVCQSSRSRLVNDTLHVETCNLTGFFSCLSLRVGEVSRNGNHSIGYFLSEIILGSFFHLLKYHCRNFLWRVLASFNVNTRLSVLVYHGVRHAFSLFTALFVGLAHETFNRVNGIFGVGDGLTFSRITHLTFAVFHKSHHRWCGAFALTVGNYHRFVAFKNGNTTVCCS